MFGSQRLGLDSYRFQEVIQDFELFSDG